MAGSALLKRFSFTIDLKRPVSIRPFEVVEGDTGNRLEVTLTDDGTAMDLSNCSVTAVFSTSAGISVQESGDESVSIDGGTVTIDLFPESFAPGMVECELQIYTTQSETNDTLVTTAKFNFGCRRAILNGESIEHTTQFPLLTELTMEVEAAEAARAAAEAARQEAERLRQYAENARTSQEEARVSNEMVRINNEVARVAAENARASAENGRASAETQRAAAEAARATAEAARAAAEAQRATAESARAAAETQRAAEFESMMASAGIETVQNDPEYETAAQGKLAFSLSSRRVFVNTAASNAAQGCWRRFAFDDGWHNITDLTLRTDSQGFVAIAEDDDMNRIQYDELRVTVIGALKNTSSANIYLNDDMTSYISDSGFLARNPADPAKCVSVLLVKKPRLGFAETERRRGGVADTDSAATVAVHSGFLPMTGTGYSSIRINAAGTNGVFAAGSRIIVEGRNTA